MAEHFQFPDPNISKLTLDEITGKTHELSKNSEKVWIDCPHVKQRMQERKISVRQILDVLRNGKGIDGPTVDKYGDFRIKLRRHTAGKMVQMVIAFKEDHIEVVTVI